MTASLERLRATYRDTGELAPLPRQDIARSWQRSLEHGVAPDAEFSFVDELDTDSRFCHAAGPVFSRLSQTLTGTGTSLFLADAQGVLLRRWVDTPQLGRKLDRANSLPGAVIDEKHVGTNGVGTVLVTRQAMTVAGAEHWVDGYQNLACSCAPIRNPVTGQWEGVLAVSSNVDDAHAVVLSLVHDAAAAVEESLRIEAPFHEQALLAQYMRAVAAPERAVIAVSGDLIISSPAAERLVGAIDRTLLWEQVSEVESTKRGTRAVFTQGDTEIEATITPSDLGTCAGVLVQLAPHVGGHAAPRGRARPANPPGLVGATKVWADVVAAIDAALLTHRNLRISGASGTGKTVLAQAISGTRSSAVVTIDGDLEVIDGAAVWAAHVREALTRPGVVIIRHVESISEPAGRAVRALLANVTLAQVVVTVDTSREQTLGGRFLLEGLDAVEIRVPDLVDRIDDIVVLVQHFGQARRWSQEAIRALVRYRWPGNIRELRQVVHGVRNTGRAVALGDLPVRYQQAAATRVMTRIERAEMAELREALRETGGNKAAAAALLGISRSSLYRKMAAAGIGVAPPP